VEPQAALVGPDRAVHLDPIAAVDLIGAAIVLPGHTEHHHALGLDESLEDLGAAVLGPALEDQIQRFDDFLHRLMELGLARVLGLHLRHQIAHEVRAFHVGNGHTSSFSRMCGPFYNTFLDARSRAREASRSPRSRRAACAAGR
jgi:hypothetical protein